MAWARTAERLDHFVGQVFEIEVDALEHQPPGLDLGEVEDVVDEAEQRVAVVAHDAEELLLVAVQGRFFEQLRHAEDRVHRSANLVRHAGEKFRLGLRGGQRRFARRHEVVLGRGQLLDLRLESLLRLVQRSFAFSDPRNIVSDTQRAGFAIHIDDDRRSEVRDHGTLEQEIDLELVHVSISHQFLYECLALLRPRPLADLERRSCKCLLSAEPGTPEKLGVYLKELSVRESSEGHEIRHRIEQLTHQRLGSAQARPDPTSIGLLGRQPFFLVP